MTEDIAYCLFCNQETYLTKGRMDATETTPYQPGQFIQSWVLKIELEDFSGLKSTHEAVKGSMFLCQYCLEKMHRSIENNLKLASK